jgi:uncharacterized protein
MPEYLAPGVYVEETSFRSKSIEGVSTTTTGFIGPTRYGPVRQEPDIITSLGEFERAYGGGAQLTFGEVVMDNFTWHAARAFFTEGGKRLYVSRVFRRNGPDDDGHGTATAGGVTFRARYPGAFGDFVLRLTLKAGTNILGQVIDPGDPQRRPRTTLGALADRDVVWISDTGSPLAGEHIYLAEHDTTRQPLPWKFTGMINSPPDERSPADLVPDPRPGAGDAVRVLTATLEVLDADGVSLGIWPDLPLDPNHRTGGFPDSLFARFGEREEARGLPITITAGGLGGGTDVVLALFASIDGEDTDFSDGDRLSAGITREIRLRNGNDGGRPGAGEYEGTAREDESFTTGLKQFEGLEDISIVAAPGSTWNYANFRDDANTITGLLLAHAQKMKYRIAVLDSAQNQTISDVRRMRAKLDSKYGALYFPWVRVLDPITRRAITLPPSGFVAGIYARNDVNRAVYKAPANEVVNLALGFEIMLNKAQQEVLNPEGVNCFRFFEGRGMLVWGARTISSDPEWKYVNLRRYFAYLERSIDRGTQWAVFEPNGERLWANVRRTISDFLLNEWQMGALLGDRPEKAYFVRCDRTTMTQNDLDNGRLVCLIGVAALKPAEFVIFRIGQWTADHKV